ncbi:MAG: GNVR domain-containing protein [Bacillota bacterium]
MDEEISLREIVLVLLRRKWIIAGITAASLVAAAVLSWWVLPTVYEAKVTIGVPVSASPPPAQGASPVEVLVRAAGAPLSLSVEGYRLHVKHPAVLQAALEKVGVKKSVGEFANAVSTKVVKDTSLIEITVEERDPALAAQLANALAEEYIRYLRQLGAGQSSRAAAVLEEQMKQADERLSAAMEEWRDFLASVPGTDELKAELEARVHDLTTLKSEADRVEVELAATAASLEAAEADLARISPVIVTRRSLTDDDVLRELVSALSGDRASALRGLSVTTEAVNEAYTEAMNRVASLRSDLAGLRTRLAGVRQAVVAARNEVQNLRVQLAEQQVQEDKLQTRLQAARESYLTLARKYEEISAAGTGELVATGIQIVGPAEVPDTPVKPRRLLNVAVATVLGLMVGVFVAFFADYWERSAAVPSSGQGGLAT